MNHSSSITLTDFTSLLINEILGGIINSTIEQEKKILEIEKEAYRDLEDFQKKNISNIDIREELKYLFPIKIEKKNINKTSVDHGQLYIPETENHTENPEIFSNIGYKMIFEEDYYKVENENIYKITKLGYQRISNVVGLILARNQQIILKNLISKGFPKVLMNSGRINSKVIFSLNNNENKRSIIVNTVNCDNAVSLPSESNNQIISELEINFRSIVP